MAMDAYGRREDPFRNFNIGGAAPLKISARFVDQAGVMHSLQTLAAVYTRVELELTTCGAMDNDIILSCLVRFDGRITHFPFA